MGKYRVRVCRGPTCGAVRNSAAVAEEFRRLLEAAGTDAEMCWQSCFGRCTRGPNVLVRLIDGLPVQRTFSVATPPPSSGGPATMYNYVTPSDVVDIVQEHLVAGRPVQRLIGRRKKRYAADDIALEQEGLGRKKRDGES